MVRKPLAQNAFQSKFHQKAISAQCGWKIQCGFNCPEPHNKLVTKLLPKFVQIHLGFILRKLNKLGAANTAYGEFRFGSTSYNLGFLPWAT